MFVHAVWVPINGGGKHFSLGEILYLLLRALCAQCVAVPHRRTRLMASTFSLDTGGDFPAEDVKSAGQIR